MKQYNTYLKFAQVVPDELAYGCHQAANVRVVAVHRALEKN